MPLLLLPPVTAQVTLQRNNGTVWRSPTATLNKTTSTRLTAGQFQYNNGASWVTT